MFFDILLVIILLLIAPTAIAGVIGAPLALSNKEMLKQALKKADIKQGDKFYDLGSGTGRVLIEAVKQTKAKAVGFELSPIYYVLTWLNLKKHKLKKEQAQVFLKNFYRTNLSQADIVFCFSTPRRLPKIKRKLEQELKPGSKVISYCFSMPDWQAIETIKKDNRLPVYIYQIC